MKKSEILEMVRVSMSMLDGKYGTANKYVFNTLKNVFEYIKDNKAVAKTFDRTKYFSRGVECVHEIINVFGLESAYIYCIIQVYKHMYLHDNDSGEKTEYSTAEFYRLIANDIEKKINERYF